MIHLTAMLLVVCLAISIQAAPSTQPFENYTLDYSTPVDPGLQKQVEAIDSKLREKLGIKPEETNVGVLDLNNLHLALIHPDHEEYAASVAKVGILLAYFQLHPQAATSLDPTVAHELGMMAKASNNEMASKYSHKLGLKKIQAVLDLPQYHFYDKDHGGGIWVGKHYGADKERYGSPVADNSHAATVRQLLRYFLMLEQGKLVSPEASKKMREIFATPDIPHDDIKFVKGLKGRDVQIIRKWGTWENWLHDCALVTGGGRHYIIVALTNTPKGDDYLEALAPAVDDLMSRAK